MSGYNTNILILREDNKERYTEEIDNYDIKSIYKKGNNDIIVNFHCQTDRNTRSISGILKLKPESKSLSGRQEIQRINFTDRYIYIQNLSEIIKIPSSVKDLYAVIINNFKDIIIEKEFGVIKQFEIIFDNTTSLIIEFSPKNI